LPPARPFRLITHAVHGSTLLKRPYLPIWAITVRVTA
jgi:hypothetical protein